MGRISELIRIGPISGFRLRTKLLLLALTTLALPWAGCQYAREMETVLRESEQQSLLAVATTIAGSLKGRQELLFRAGFAAGIEQWQRARHHARGALGRAAHRRTRGRMGHRFAQPHSRCRAGWRLICS